MLWLIASVLLLGWIVLLAFEVTAAAVHVLLVAAVAVYLWSVVRGRPRTRTPA
jgi:hypothetical protein